MTMIWSASPFAIFWLAADPIKILSGLVLGVVMVGIMLLILRSMGIDSQTPPAMVWRKIKLFFGALILPILASRKLKEADILEEGGKLSEALAIYLRLFDFDGMLSSNATLAIHNETLLERIEDICERTGYDFPAEQINRFREDIYDYYLVRQMHLTPVDYDGTPLHRPENEDRFKDKLNMTQERDLIKGFEHFLSTLIQRIQEHLHRGGVVARPRVKKPQVSPSQVGLNTPDVPMGAEDSADAAGEQGDIYRNDPERALPARGFAPPSGHAAPPKEANPFSVDDPRSPFSESTGTLRKLTGVEEDQPSANPFASPAPAAPNANPFAQRSQDALAAVNGGPVMPMQARPAGMAIPQPAAMPVPAMAAPAPQPTGGFPNFGQAPATTPSGTFPAPGGFPGAAPRPAAPSFPQPVSPQTMAPQPTGGFPGFQGPPLGGQAPRPAASGFPQPMAPQPMAPQPTGGFPGFQGPPLGGQAPRPAAPGFPQPMGPQPTGGFPGFQGPPQAAPMPPAGAPFPQPTGGFPGMQGPSTGSMPSPRPAAPGFPQPTGGFPGFQGPPQSAPMPPAGSPFPQPTGGFPGFQGPPAGFPGQKK